MSKKLKLYNSHRYTKKIPQFGGGEMYRLNYISCTGENDTTVFDNLTTTFDTRQVTITKSNCEHIKASDDTSGLQSSQMFYNITVTINEDVVQNLQKLKDFARDNNIDLFDSQDKKVDTSPEPTIAESTSSAQTTTSSETHPVSNAPPSNILSNQTIDNASTNTEVEYDETEFNKLYKELVENNDKIKVEVKGKLFGTNKVPIIIKPTDIVGKTALYNLLVNIKKSANTSGNSNDKGKLALQQTEVSTFFNTLKKLKDSNQGELNEAILNNTSLGKFIKRLYDAEKTSEGMMNAAGRLIPIVSIFRDWHAGKYNVSFDTKAAGEEALAKQRKDIETGIENEFAIMSAFIGTPSQQVATKTAILAGAATGLWALVSKIQQNPQLSSMIMASVAGIAGPQAAIVGGVIIGASLCYFVYLKVQDKYAKYFNLIRTMNEFMIVMNKIDRLVRLSVFISTQYSFDVNLKEIVAQLEILFKRFDKMLSEDDISQIEKSYITNPNPDLAKAADDAHNNQNPQTIVENGEQTTLNKKDGGGRVGDFIFKFTFDIELWNQKLNEDVMKLNLYFTTAMTEFSMILNVIQMGLITSENKTKLKTANDEVKGSTEYRKMVIGILLNDILKLRVDLSYCNRGSMITNTKGEGICTDPENLGTDTVGNRRSRFKEKLHGLMEHLVEVLNSQTYPYTPEIKKEIIDNVVQPYKQMILNAAPKFGKGNTFYLTDGASLLPDEITTVKNKALEKITAGTAGGGILDTIGTKFRRGSNLEKVSPERDKDILNELNKQARAYDFVDDETLMKFLMSVDKFVKDKTEPSQKEKEEAKKVAEEVAKMEQTAAVTVIGTGTGPEEQDPTAQDQTEQGPQRNSSGGRRLTRKRSFKPKKNRRNTRGLKAAPFKSAAAALKAYHRK